MKKPSYAYFACMIDGEGSILLTRHAKNEHRAPAISVTSTTIEFLEALKDRFGGNICKQKVYKAHHKQSWVWKVTHNKAISLLEKVSPYMLDPRKVGRAKLILSEYKQVTQASGVYNEEELAVKLDFEKRFREL